MKKLSRSLLAGALALAALPFAAQAESDVVTGTGNAEAALDFRITIPRVLLLQVGSTGSAVNLIDFDVTAGQLTALTPVAATAPSGDVGNGTVTARVLGNDGQVSIAANASGALQNADGDTISYANITTSSSNATALPAPTLTNATSSAVFVPTTSGTKITNVTAQWTYQYQNSALVPSGTYGGVNTNNGRVTYTASMP